MKVFKSTDRTMSPIRVVIERCEKDKIYICIGKAKSMIVVDERMKLIFHHILKSAVDVDCLGLFVSKQLGVGS